jgi:hypothetical protein
MFDAPANFNKTTIADAERSQKYFTKVTEQ